MLSSVLGREEGLLHVEEPMLWTPLLPTLQQRR